MKKNFHWGTRELLRLLSRAPPSGSSGWTYARWAADSGCFEDIKGCGGSALYNKLKHLHEGAAQTAAAHPADLAASADGDGAAPEAVDGSEHDERLLLAAALRLADAEPQGTEDDFLDAVIEAVRQAPPASATVLSDERVRTRATLAPLGKEGLVERYESKNSSMKKRWVQLERTLQSMICDPPAAGSLHVSFWQTAAERSGLPVGFVRRAVCGSPRGGCLDESDVDPPAETDAVANETPFSCVEDAAITAASHEHIASGEWADTLHRAANDAISQAASSGAPGCVTRTRFACVERAVELSRRRIRQLNLASLLPRRDDKRSWIWRYGELRELVEKYLYVVFVDTDEEWRSGFQGLSRSRQMRPRVQCLKHAGLEGASTNEWTICRILAQPRATSMGCSHCGRFTTALKLLAMLRKHYEGRAIVTPEWTGPYLNGSNRHTRYDFHVAWFDQSKRNVRPEASRNTHFPLMSHPFHTPLTLSLCSPLRFPGKASI